ncbi:hypothetical protein P3T73_11680 [Kiritimatiellota bacterium B12222]|nr:hypothetical protein P3T73_11680 [Kiritimatiellota bacterium B12222]
MPLYLFLSDDQTLLSDLEACLAGEEGPANILQAHSFEELDSYQKSLQGVEAVFLDLDRFDPPDHVSYPLICLGDADTVYPQVHKPLHAQALVTGLRHLKQRANQEHTQGADPHYHEFIGRLVKEVAHDLNNHFTILRGQLPLLQLDYPDEAEVFSDLIHATEKSTGLIHLLEGLIPDCLAGPGKFSLTAWLTEFGHFAKKIYPYPFRIENSVEDPSLECVGDAPLITCLCLKICWIFKPTESPLLFSMRSKADGSIECKFVCEALDSSQALDLESSLCALKSLQASLGLRFRASHSSLSFILRTQI